MDRKQIIEYLENGVFLARAVNTVLVHINVETAEQILELLKEQETEIRQLRLALDIAKGTCKGIVMEGR